MLTIRSSADMARALDGPLAPELRRLLVERRDQLTGPDLSGVAHFLVVGPGDTLASVEAAVGLPLTTDPLDDDPDFLPAFESVQRHGDWIEAAIILNDDGFALALFVPDRIDVDPAILRVRVATTRRSAQ